MNNLLQYPARAWHRDGMTLLKGREGCYLQSPDGLQLRLAAAESPADPRPGASSHELDRPTSPADASPVVPGLVGARARAYKGESVSREIPLPEIVVGRGQTSNVNPDERSGSRLAVR